ncbi:MAG: Gfo/Idh/MocA family oxidoreductase [Ruminococcaceae bacterium]|nr:Gfo/Idh/MocA family oxidoreductase [Oscillospiraceae bacterium]
MKKIKVGIIGMGYIGESHIEAVRRIGCCELYAVADTNAELAKAKAEQYGIEKCYSSVEELLADGEIDAVHNCTPNFLHLDINKEIIKSGKHLLSEKPLCMDYVQAKELVELKKQYPESVAAVNFNYRLNPMVQEMRSRIKNGKIGDVRIMTGSYEQDWLMYDTDYSWRLEPEVSGNSCAMADIGSHWMDAVQHVTGHKIVEVMADLKTIIPVRKKPKKQTETFTSAIPTEFDEVEIKNEDYGAVIFHTDKGGTGVFHVSQLTAGRGCFLNFEISGSEATLRWNQEENDRLWMGFRGGDNHLIIRDPNAISEEAGKYTALAKGHPEGWNDAFKGNIYAFYKYIEDGCKGEEIFSTLEQAAYIVKLTEAIIESSKTKSWVKVNN